MAKKLQFKAQHGRMIVPGLGEVTNENLTQELYNKLISLSESHKDLFEEVDVVEAKPKESKKTKTES